MRLQLRKKAISRQLASLRSDQGMAAVEFAFIAPVLVAMVLTLSDVSDMAVGTTNMQAAVRAAAQYFANGNTDTTAGETQGNNAWVSNPSGSSLTATQVCKCGSTVTDCTLFCADGTQPNMYFTITATATLGGSIMSSSKTITETVRVR